MPKPEERKIHSRKSPGASRWPSEVYCGLGSSDFDAARNKIGSRKTSPSNPKRLMTIPPHLWVEYGLRGEIVHGFVRRKAGWKDNKKKPDADASGFDTTVFVAIKLLLMQCRIALHDHGFLGHFFHFTE